MDRDTEERLRTIVRARIAKQSQEIENSLVQIEAGNPLGAEPSDTRRAARIARKTRLSPRDAKAMATMIATTAKLIDKEGALALDGAEAVQGPTIDIVGVEFLTRGRTAASAVGRVAFRSGRAQGSGFLVAPGLFLTNYHVIGSPEQSETLMVQFDYEAADDGTERPVTSFAFEPGTCFVSDPIEGLDFTLIAIGARLSGPKSLAEFGHLPLSDAKDKHMLGELANIIQHPNGDLKQIVVRENNLVSRDETEQVLHYLADTEQGSSGSPVMNNSWEPIALHHWGEPFTEIKGRDGKPLRKEVNEGIRISAIVKDLRNRAPVLADSSGQAIADALALWDASPTETAPALPEASNAPESPSSTRSGASVTHADGAITWTFPIEISVRAPLLEPQKTPTPPKVVTQSPKTLECGPEKRTVEPLDFSDRGGYEPGFIPGFVVALPDYGNVGYRLAENRMPHEGVEDPHELQYHHFSILMNAERRLAAFTACNIDGRRLVAVNREDKTVNLDPTLHDLGAEATDAFSPDPRVLGSEQMTREFYEDQVVPGFPKPPSLPKDASPAEKKAHTRAMLTRTARMFQKGHITLRGDPAWGTEEAAVAAESDTFFYTNAAPQLGFFNQGSPVNAPGSKGALRWRTVETYVLRNAFTTRKRVCVFAGPIFDDDKDPEYRFGVLVPMKFWKVVVWAEGKTLKSIALWADQRPVLEKLTKGMPEAAAEAFEDLDEVARASEFLTTVEEIEALTKLDFGDLVRSADVRAGAESMSLASPSVEAGQFR
ncbi:DNA/RNA non-specific endonuclease [Cupriavidus sp. 8B]